MRMGDETNEASNSLSNRLASMESAKPEIGFGFYYEINSIIIASRSSILLRNQTWMTSSTRNEALQLNSAVAI